MNFLKMCVIIIDGTSETLQHFQMEKLELPRSYL